jgi:antitoxin (DNA-binding transcriptional repressor) of toxin-antitoxin stability system
MRILMATRKVNIHEAKTHLSKLIQDALSGTEVIIAKNNRPLVRLDVLPEARLKRKIGQAKGLVLYMADDFDAPLEDFKDYMD